MTPPEAGPLAVASLLLAAGGAIKLARPDTTVNALRAAGWRVGPGTVRAGAAIELSVAATALVAGGVIVAALVAASYVLLAGFVTVALVNGTPLATCACFGEADTPPTVLHALVNASLSIGAALAAVTGSAQPLVALNVELAIGAGVAAYVTFLVLTALPRLGWQ